MAKKLKNVLLCCYLDRNMAQWTVSPVRDLATEFMKNVLGSSKRQHNLEAGKREPGDTLLYKEEKRRDFKWLDYVSEVYEHCGDDTITAVVAEDNWSDDTGGDPKIIRGGPGHKYVAVKVTSKISRGFNHTVYVYGKKKD